MSILLSVIISLGAVLFDAFIVMKIRKAQMKIESAISMIGMALVILLLGVFPQIAVWGAEILGIESPVNLIYLILIVLLLFQVISLSVKMSIIEYKLTSLTEEIAVRNMLANNKEE